MIINHNMMAMNSHRMMGINSSTMGKSTEKLSSGLRVNRAADDAAGLSISEKMRGQIRGLTQASRNAQDAISVVQTAEGALDEAHSILQRMRQLAVQSANDSNVEADREAIQREVTQLTDELDRIAGTTEFNTQKLLDGSFQDRVFHVGANKDQNIKVNVKEMSAKGLGLRGGLDKTPPQAVLDEVAKKAASVQSLEESVAASNSSIAAKESTIAGIRSTLAGMRGTLAKLEGSLATAQGRLKAAEDKIEVRKEKIKALEEKLKVTTDPATQSALAGSIAVLEASVAAIEVESVATFKASIGKKLTTIAGKKGSIAIKEGSMAAKEGSLAKIKEVMAEDQKKIKRLSKELEVLREELRLGVKPDQGVKVSTQASANQAIKTINDALTKVSTQRSELGAIQNRLDHTIRNLDNAAENTQAAESRIRDIDMALEMSEFTKKNILTQASQAMLAQANQLPQQVLQLLR